VKENRSNYPATYALRDLTKYVPIGIVACMQTFFRNIVQELTDCEGPYAVRAAKLIRDADVKPDYEILLAIQGKRFTFGEFVSHAVSLSSLESINRVLSGLLDRDFLSLLKEVDLESKRWEREDLGVRQLGDSAPKIFDAVKHTIELRNAFAHEAPDSLMSPDDDLIDDIAHGFESTKVFLIAADIWFFRLLYPGEPEAPTQAEMNERGYKRFREAKARLEDVLKRYKGFLSPDRVRELDEFQERWIEFAARRADFEANEYRGGTIMPTIRASQMESFTQMRIEEVERAIEKEQRLRTPLPKPYARHRKK
jgi:uncharacterized protein YecT (DUF1311 family)